MLKPLIFKELKAGGCPWASPAGRRRPRCPGKRKIVKIILEETWTEPGWFQWGTGREEKAGRRAQWWEMACGVAGWDPGVGVAPGEAMSSSIVSSSLQILLLLAQQPLPGEHRHGLGSKCVRKRQEVVTAVGHLRDLIHSPLKSTTSPWVWVKPLGCFGVYQGKEQRGEE